MSTRRGILYWDDDPEQVIEMKSCDHYQALGVSRYASDEAIRRAFRLRVLESHPDLNANDSSACERTRAIIEAYHALVASERRGGPDCSAAVPNASRCSPYVGAYRARTVPRVSSLLIAFLVSALVAALLWSAEFGNRTRVYRPQFVPQPEYEVSTLAAPSLLEPNLDDAERWYWMREYNVSLGAQWAEMETARLSGQQGAFCSAHSRLHTKLLARY